MLTVAHDWNTENEIENREKKKKEDEEKDGRKEHVERKH